MGRTLKIPGSKTETTYNSENIKGAPAPVGVGYLIAAGERQGLSTRSPEMAMAAAALTGVSLGIWIMATLDGFKAILSLIAVILTLTAGAFAIMAAAGFKKADKAYKSLNSQNEKMADRLWEISESEERSSNLFDQLGDLVIVCDARRHILRVNNNFSFAVGKSHAELVGKTFSSLGIIVPRTAQRTSTGPVDVQIAGHWYSWIELRSPSSKADGPALRIVARDVHTRKESETQLIDARQKAEAANQAKSQFLATVSHEIRTPLNGITGMARLLADTSLTQEQYTYVQAVTASGQSLLTMIEDLLDFSKIEAGRLDLRPEQLELRGFCENLVELVSARAHSKGLGISTVIDPKVPIYIVTDSDRLRQSLLNLLGNAIKFTETGGISLEVCMTHGNVELAVRDSGPGLKAEDHQRIFDEFEQVESGSTRSHGGVGLGLSITRKLIKAMGGSVGVESQLGSGAVFSIKLPCFVLNESDAPLALNSKRCFVALRSTSEATALSQTISSYGGKSDHYQTAGSNEEFAAQAGAILLIDAASAQALQADNHDLTHFERRIILIEPGERGRLAQFHENGYETYLVRPIRANSLIRVLLGRSEPDRKSNNNQPKLRAISKEQRQLSILVAEDNEINALLVKAALTRSGHRVIVVGDGRSAVTAALVLVDRPDFILMDLHMPVLDGLDAIAAIRVGEDELGLTPIPIYALTADGQAGVESAVRAIGGNGYVTKPVDPLRLVTIVEEAVAA